jgi:pentatricopeptide repeat protein
MLDHMVYEGLEPDLVIYNTIMDALCKEGETKKAEKLLHMASRGMHHDIHCLIDVLMGF